MATKTIPVNNYNDSDNYGTSGAAPSLYSDKHYLDGDGFLYGLGMASQRMIVKGKTTDIDTDFFFWNGNGTSAKLGLNLLNLENTLKGVGLTVSAGRLNVNVGQGLYIGTQSSSSSTMNKVNINLFKKNVTFDGATSLYNTSGLEFVTGTEDTSTGAPANSQLKIKLAEMGSGTSFSNVSGLILKDPANVEGMSGIYATEGLSINYGPGLTLNNSLQLDLNLYTKKSGNKNESGLIIASNSTAYTGGLKINYGTGLMLNASGQLVVDSSAVVPNISGTNPIEVTTSGNNKAIGLKLLAGTQQGDISGMRVVEAGTVEGEDTLLGGLAVNVQSPLSIKSISTGVSAVSIDGEEFITWLGNGSSSWGLGHALSHYTINGKQVIGVDSSIAGAGLTWNNGSVAFDLNILGNGLTVPNNKVVVKPYHGITVDGNGVSVKPKPNSGIDVDASGVYLKVASTSEIGGLKVGSAPTTPTNATVVDSNLLKNSNNNVGYVRSFVYNTADDTLDAQKYPYTAQYINNNYSTNTQIDTKIAAAISDISGREYKIFQDLPAKGSEESWADFYAAYKKYIALVSNIGTAPDAYEEYILVVTNDSTKQCQWEKVGDTKFTTDNFVAKTDILTKTEVDNIIQDVFGF